MSHKLPKLTVAALRKSGSKVRVLHLRRFVPAYKLTEFVEHPNSSDFKNGRIEKQDIPYKVAAKGGKTVIEIDTKGGKYFMGESLVANNDYYNKKSGVNICLTRIASQAKELGVELV